MAANTDLEPFFQPTFAAIRLAVAQLEEPDPDASRKIVELLQEVQRERGAEGLVAVATFLARAAAAGFMELARHENVPTSAPLDRYENHVRFGPL